MRIGDVYGLYCGLFFRVFNFGNRNQDGRLNLPRVLGGDGLESNL